MFLSVPLVVYAALSLYHAPVLRAQIEIEREVENKSIYEGEVLDVTVQVTNRGPSKSEVIEVTDTIPDELGVVSGSNRAILQLNPGESTSFSYSLRSESYGQFGLGPARIKMGDLLNSKSIYFTEKNLTEVWILPKVSYLPKIGMRPRITRNWPGEILSKRRGQGLEFYGIFDYALGDPVRRINWKVSSKSAERLFTNQFISELGGDTVIVVDARQASEVGLSPNSTLSYSVRAAALVSYRLLRDRNRVGLVIAGSSLTRILPGFGRRQFDRMLLALSMTRASGYWEIKMIGKYLSTFFSRSVLIVFVSPLVDETSIEAALDISARGYRVLVISPSPIDAEKLSSEGEEDIALAERLARLKRSNRLRRLSATVPVVDWAIGSPLSDSLVEATQQWRRAR